MGLAGARKLQEAESKVTERLIPQGTLIHLRMGIWLVGLLADLEYLLLMKL